MSNEIREMIDRVRNFKVLNENIGSAYYRIVKNFEGDTVIFEPNGFYESTDDDGNPIMHSGGVWSRSSKPEIAASKTIGGAVLGLWSMGNSNGFEIKTGYLYKINDKPQKDLSHLRFDDFEWLKEVRYLTSVKGTYIGKFTYTDQFNKSAANFYKRLNQSEYDEDLEIDVEDWDKFENYILTIGESDLN